MAQRKTNGVDIPIGTRFGKLTVISLCVGSRHRRRGYECLCDCGGTVIARSLSLRLGFTTDCKACMSARRTARATKHGHAKRGGSSRTYSSWRNMINRTTDPKHRHWARYGGRGITVCERWMEFGNFLSDMGERPKGTTLDRKDNDGGYTKDNCKWSTPREQCSNTSRNILVEFNGETVTLSELSRRVGVSLRTLVSRYHVCGLRMPALIQTVAAPATLSRVEFNGQSITLSELSSQVGLGIRLLVTRYRMGKRGADLIRPVAARYRSVTHKLV